ncbi:YeeE/YedE family protein [Thaumasiovibrio sp. DFM-14]|uniref:YeeE/YedE family protein n=1 Tax=Thaumasiovibrio sp. DFM-14 TaxID=3384792 RepID=UPI0039A00D88
MLFEIPWDGLRGGMLLGLSAALLLIVNGRIAGISGIFSGVLKPREGEITWRLLFLLGMVVGGFAALALGYEFPLLESGASHAVSPLSIVVAGLLVGIGARLGNGCTSGHGICGIGRMSKRSIIATCTFMAVAMLTVFIRLHII